MNQYDHDKLGLQQQFIYRNLLLTYDVVVLCIARTASYIIRFLNKQNDVVCVAIVHSGVTVILLLTALT